MTKISIKMYSIKILVWIRVVAHHPQKLLLVENFWPSFLGAKKIQHRKFVKKNLWSKKFVQKLLLTKYFLTKTFVDQRVIDIFWNLLAVDIIEINLLIISVREEINGRFCCFVRRVKVKVKTIFGQISIKVWQYYPHLLLISQSLTALR